jgi:hypothetical protein
VAAKGNQTSGGAGDQLTTSGVATVKSLTLGGATLTNQPVSVETTAAPGVEGVDQAGMIGYEFFARFVTRFDYGRHTVAFFDKRYFDPKNAGTAVPMHLYHQFPEIVGTYNGIPGRFGIDTGSRLSLEFTAPFASAHNIRAQVQHAVVATSGWGVGGPTRSLVFRGGRLTLGDVAIEHPLTMISMDKGGAGAAEGFPNNVGGGVLKRFAVTFDYDHSTMYLKPVKGPIADLDTFDRSGMWINQVPEGFKVFDVTAGGPGEAAGLQKGDIITAVNGKNASAIPVYEMRRRLRNDAPGTVVKFTVVRDGKSREVQVTLRDLM